MVSEKKKYRSILTSIVSASLLFVTLVYLGLTANTLQLDIGPILNSRAVTTFHNGKLNTWTKGIDNDNGYVTSAAAHAMSDNSTFNLPDNPLIPASEFHPEILLHYSNEDSKSNQVAILTDTGTIKISLPPAHYKKLFLSLTSAYGSSVLEVTLVYKDGYIKQNFTLPDWYNDLNALNPAIVYVVHNLSKWDVNSRITERDHHNIDAIVLNTDAYKILTSVVVKKTNKGRLLLWAATAITSE